jgi:hypothetical protein
MLYNIQTKARRKTWAGHAARMTEMRDACKVLFVNDKERNYLLCQPQTVYNTYIKMVLSEFNWLETDIGGRLL